MSTRHGSSGQGADELVEAFYAGVLVGVRAGPAVDGRHDGGRHRLLAVEVPAIGLLEQVDGQKHGLLVLHGTEPLSRPRAQTIMHRFAHATPAGTALIAISRPA